jgi:hypothetical protein
MPRDHNLLETKQLTLSTTHPVTEYLGDLSRTGLWGKNPAEAAERLIADSIRRLIQDGTLRVRVGKKARAFKR